MHPRHVCVYRNAHPPPDTLKSEVEFRSKSVEFLDFDEILAGREATFSRTFSKRRTITGAGLTTSGPSGNAVPDARRARGNGGREASLVEGPDLRSKLRRESLMTGQGAQERA